MAKKLNRIIVRGDVAKEEGFVLATSLLLLMLLTMLAVSVFYSANVSQQTSAAARDGTEAFYYAETGINYIAWALKNDAEFDSFPTGIVKRLPANGGVFDEPKFPKSPPLPKNFLITVGDRYELFANLSDPGPTAISDTSTAGTTGQVMYFDNTHLADRAVCWSGIPTTPPTPTRCKNKAGIPILPVFDGINKKLPRYIMLTIDTSGKITPIIPALPHGAAVGTDIPKNGAIVWITAGGTNEDAEILSLTDPACLAVGIPAGDSCYQGASAAKPTAVPIYGIVAYAIGYVNGRALRMIRSVIM